MMEEMKQFYGMDSTKMLTEGWVRFRREKDKTLAGQGAEQGQGSLTLIKHGVLKNREPLRKMDRHVEREVFKRLFFIIKYPALKNKANIKNKSCIAANFNFI